MSIFFLSLTSGIFFPRADNFSFQLISLNFKFLEYLLRSLSENLYFKPRFIIPCAELFLVGCNNSKFFYSWYFANPSNSLIWSEAYPSGWYKCSCLMFFGSYRSLICLLSITICFLTFVVFLRNWRPTSLWTFDNIEMELLWEILDYILLAALWDTIDLLRD